MLYVRKLRMPCHLWSINLAPILKALSDEIRQKRSAEIEKKGAQAATKILFPMLMFILPAVMIIIAAPFIIGFITGDG